MTRFELQDKIDEDILSFMRSKRDGNETFEPAFNDMAKLCQMISEDLSSFTGGINYVTAAAYIVNFEMWAKQLRISLDGTGKLADFLLSMMSSVSYKIPHRKEGD